MPADDFFIYVIMLDSVFVVIHVYICNYARLWFSNIIYVIMRVGFSYGCLVCLRLLNGITLWGSE